MYHIGSVLSAIGSIFSSLASQSSATSIGQLPPEARERAEDAIAGVLVKSPGVSIIIAKGVDKLGQQRVEWLMAKALRQFSSAIKPPLDKDTSLLRESFCFIERRAASIAGKIRESTQPKSLAVRDKAAIKKYLEDMHLHKVPPSGSTSEEPPTFHGPEYTDGEESEDEELGKPREIKPSHKPDKSKEPISLGEHFLRQITEYLASDKDSRDFLHEVKDDFTKVNDRKGRVDGGGLIAKQRRPELENEEEPDKTLLAERSGPEPENEGKEPHNHPSVADDSLEQDGKHPIETVGGNNAREDPAIQIPEIVNAVAAAPRVCTDKWPALFAAGKTDIYFDDRNIWSLSNEIKGWIENKIGARVNWWPLSARREPLLDGFFRVTWKCRCGRSLSGIISTARKVQYDQWRSASNGELSAQSISLSSMGQGGDLESAATSCSNGASWLRLPWRRKPSSADGADRGNPPNGQDPTTYERYLLLCVNTGTLQERLEPLRPTVVRPIVIANGDKGEQIFSKLSKEYHETRSFWGRVSLHVVSEIRYVKFEKIPKDRVKCYPEQEYPPKNHPEYECWPPGGERSEVPPPILAEELMEYFRDPSCAEATDNQHDIAFESFPKKLSRKTEKIAWGLRACEQLSLYRILLLFGLVLAGTLVFVPYWLLGHPGDLQNAFVPPIFFLAFASALIGASTLCIGSTAVLQGPIGGGSPPGPNGGRPRQDPSEGRSPQDPKGGRPSQDLDVGDGDEAPK